MISITLIHNIMLQGKISWPHSNFAAKNASQIGGNALAQTPLGRGGGGGGGGMGTALPQTPKLLYFFGPVTSLTTFLMLPTGQY